MIRSNTSQINVESSVWQLVIECSNIKASASFAATSTANNIIWTRFLANYSEDIYTNITFSKENEDRVLSFASKCPKARVVCVLASASPPASEMEVKFASTAFNNIFVVLDEEYDVSSDANPLLLEHLQAAGGMLMSAQGSITSQLLAQCKNLREMDIPFVNLNLYSLSSARDDVANSECDTPPLLPPVKFSLPHLRTIKLRECLLFNYSIKHLLQSTGGLTHFEAHGINDQLEDPSAIRFQLLPLLKNKNLTSLVLRTRPGDAYGVSAQLLQGLQSMKLRELLLYGCHHGGHEYDVGGYGSGDDYGYERESHNLDTRWSCVYDSEPDELELEPEESTEEDSEPNEAPKRKRGGTEEIKDLPKRRKLTEQAFAAREARYATNHEDVLTGELVSFLHSQRHTLTKLELGAQLGTESIAEALSQIPSEFLHVTHLSLTMDSENSRDCCEMTEQGMALLATVFPNVVDLRLSGEISTYCVNGIVSNPFNHLTVLRFYENDGSTRAYDHALDNFTQLWNAQNIHKFRIVSEEDDMVTGDIDSDMGEDGEEEENSAKEEEA